MNAIQEALLTLDISDYDSYSQEHFSQHISTLSRWFKHDDDYDKYREFYLYMTDLNRDTLVPAWEYYAKQLNQTLKNPLRKQGIVEVTISLTRAKVEIYKPMSSSLISRRNFDVPHTLRPENIWDKKLGDLKYLLLLQKQNLEQLSTPDVQHRLNTVNELLQKISFKSASDNDIWIELHENSMTVLKTWQHFFSYLDIEFSIEDYPSTNTTLRLSRNATAGRAVLNPERIKFLKGNKK